MDSQDAHISQKPLYLSADEALALLEICLFSRVEDAPLRVEAMNKVANLCREFLKQEDPGQEVRATEDIADLSDALEQYLLDRTAVATCA